MTVGTKTVPYSIVTALGPDAAGRSIDREAAGPDALGAASDRAHRVGRSRSGGARRRHARARVLPLGRRGPARDRPRVVPSLPASCRCAVWRSIVEWRRTTRASRARTASPIGIRRFRSISSSSARSTRSSGRNTAPRPRPFSRWPPARRSGGPGTASSPRCGYARRPSALPRDARALAGTIAQRGSIRCSAGFNVVDVRVAESRGVRGRDGLRRVLFVFQFLSDGVRAAADDALLPTRHRTAALAGGRAARDGILACVRSGSCFSPRALLVTAAGALLGIVLAIGWAALMMYGLRTWWNGAVGTTRLVLHVDWLSLLAGAAAAAVVAIAAITFTVRRLGRLSPRSLLTGGRIEIAGSAQRAGAWLAVVALTGALALTIFSAAGLIPAAGGFFGAGTLVLAGGLAAVRAWLQDVGCLFTKSVKRYPTSFPSPSPTRHGGPGAASPRPASWPRRCFSSCRSTRFGSAPTPTPVPLPVRAASRSSPSRRCRSFTISRQPKAAARPASTARPTGRSPAWRSSVCVFGLVTTRVV